MESIAFYKKCVELIQTECGGNQAEFARRIAANPETVRKWLRLKSGGSPSDIAAICTAFGVSADWLVLGKEPGPTPALDHERLSGVIAGIQLVITEEEAKGTPTPFLTPGKYAELVALLYESNAPTKALIERLFRLAV